MLRRGCRRLFKSYHEYQAERMGMSFEDYMTMRVKKLEGGYQDFCRMQTTTNKINFLLDHCTPEEQKAHLEEFSTPELLKYLLNTLNSLPREELEKLANLEVRFHRLPVLDSIMSIPTAFNIAKNQSDDGLTEQQKIRRQAVAILEAKEREFTWREMDRQMSENPLQQTQ